MPEIVKKIQQKIMDFWTNLTKSQKIRLIATVAIVIVAVTVSLVVVSQPNYITLVKSSDAKQLKEITTMLDEKGIAYKMADDGQSILVNEKDKSNAQAATLGIVENGMQFEDAFNMIKINTTESDKQKLWEEYKKKNLSTKLEAISSNIEVADVDLDVPEKSTFISSEQDERKPTARVIVKPKAKLTDEQVRGIAMMVAGSVSGLNYKDVVVLDDKLNVLNANNGDDVASQLTTQEGLRIQKAKELEERVYKLYGGPSDSYEGIKIVANPILDFNKAKSIIKDVAVPTGMDPASGVGVKVSEKTAKEDAKEGVTGGVAGVNSNPNTTTPTYPTTGTGSGTYKKDTGEVNYDYKRTTTEEEKATGGMLTTDSSIALALYYGRNITDETKLTAAFISEMVQGVSKATGVPPDKISINKFKMSPLTTPKTAITDTLKALIDAYGVFGLMFVLTIGILIALMPRKKKATATTTEGELAGAGGIDVDLDEQGIPVAEIDMEEKSEVKKQIDKFAKQKPDAVAQLLRNWITDDWE